MLRMLLFGAALLLLMQQFCVARQHADAGGYIEVQRDGMNWPSPEELATGLRSADEATRLRTLKTMGFSDGEIYRDVWSQDQQPARVIGRRVVTPAVVALTYAPLGEDAARQAILAVEIDEDQLTFAAVATPVGAGWKWIGRFSCWCKYDMGVDQDALSTFVQLKPAPSTAPEAPNTFELVIRASGGGSGLYTQDEAHFRVRGGKLRKVLSFTSRRLSCPGLTCELERRWFSWSASRGDAGGRLVEGRGAFKADVRSLMWMVRELEMRKLESFSFAEYRWDATAFEYLRVKSADTCVAVER